MLKNLLLSLSATALTLSATTISLQRTSTPTTEITRTISDSTAGSRDPTYLLIGLFAYTDIYGNTTYLYCLEPQQNASPLSVLTPFEVDPALRSAPGNIGGMSASRAASVLLLLGQLANPFSPRLPALDQAAVQVGLWEILRETRGGPYNATSGNTTFSNEGVSGVIARAQQLLDGVNRGSGTPYSALAFTNSIYQDMIGGAVVPEPAAFGLMPIAGLAFAFLRARRTE